MLAEPKRRRGQGEAKGPLREIGADPDTGKPIVVKDGRFGPYVTDGETNASLRKGDMVETLTLERAVRTARRAAGRGAPAGQARPRHHQEGGGPSGGQAVQGAGQEGRAQGHEGQRGEEAGQEASQRNSASTATIRGRRPSAF